MLVKIAGGTVHDPANGVDGIVQDIWMRGGKVAAPPVKATSAPEPLQGEVEAFARGLAAWGGPDQRHDPFQPAPGG